MRSLFFCFFLALHLVQHNAEDLEHIVAILLIDLAHVGDLDHVLLGIVTLTDIEGVAADFHLIQEGLSIHALGQEHGGNGAGHVLVEQQAAAHVGQALADDGGAALIALDTAGQSLVLNDVGQSNIQGPEQVDIGGVGGLVGVLGALIVLVQAQIDVLNAIIAPLN